MNRYYASMLVLLISSFPAVSAYFGIGNFEVPSDVIGPIDTGDPDGDGMPNWWETFSWWNATCQLNPDVNDANLDPDGDGYTNLQEYGDGTNPCLTNNDGDIDGLPDRWEDENGFNKFDSSDGLADQDLDGLINKYEFQNDTDMNDPDTDNDNLPDGWEAIYGLDPLNLSDANDDNDNDNLNNLQEYVRGTDPNDSDSDNDGSLDDVDTCPTDPANGCADDDGDGVTNENDLCPNTPLSETPDVYGCSQSQRDTDGDGVNDNLDPCPSDASDSCLDSDGDGKNDYEDPCPEDPADGCVDDDSDGVVNGYDICPNTPGGQPVSYYGCSLSQIDSDDDGVSDHNDQCPNTLSGYSVDSEGCINQDSDNDGVMDPHDSCPTHNALYSVDSSGCDIVDSDGDGILDADEPTGCEGDSDPECGTTYIEPTATVANNDAITGKAEVLDNAKVLGSAEVSDFADIKDDAVVNGSANISGFAEVKGNAVVTDTANVTDNATISANATVAGNAKVAENALITEKATVKEEARVTGKAIVGGEAKVKGTSKVKGSATVTGNTTVHGDSTVSGTSKVGGWSEILDSVVNDALVYDSFIDPSTVTDSKVTWSNVRDSVVANSDLQYVDIEDLTINYDKVQPKTSGTGKIRVEDVNFTINSNNLIVEKDYKNLVDGHKRSEDLQINASGKTLKVSDEDTQEKFAEVKVITNTDVTANVTVAKATINPEGGSRPNESYGDYLIVEEDNGKLDSGLNPNTTIKIYYDTVDMNEAGEHNESTLSIKYYDNGWKDISITKRGEDATGKYVMAKVDHFSIFGIFGELLDCPITKKWCQYENDGEGGCISLLSACTAPTSPFTPSGPAGGGGPPETTPPPPATLPPTYKPTVISLTSKVLGDILISAGLLDKQFWNVPISVGAVISLTGEYPSPISPMVLGLIPSPVKLLLEPLKLVRGEEVESSKALDDIYRFTTEKVLAKYQKADTVVIAVRDTDVDAMAAIAFAKSIDAPLLLTERNAAPELTINALRKLNPQNIIIVGGPVAITEEVEAEFSTIAPTERIWGQTRYETAVELAQRLEPSMVVITDGERPNPDTIIVAAEYTAPIIYVRGNEIPDSTREFLIKNIQTGEGEPMSWVTSGVDDDINTEIQGLYSLPEFLTRNRLTLKLFQVGTRFLR